MLVFFFVCLGLPFGTSELFGGGTGGCAAGGACLLVLKDDMNSKACGASPNRFLRCSAAASLGKVSL